MFLLNLIAIMLFLLSTEGYAAVKEVVCVPDVDCAPAVQTAINGATAGDTIQLNGGTHLISSAMLINRPLHLRGAGMGQTVLVHKAVISFDGSGGMLYVGGMPTVVSGITISDMSFRGDRIADPAMRIILIRIRSRVDNLTIRDVGFDGCTSSCVVINGWNVTNFKLVGNHANEYYEQFVEVSAGDSYNFVIANNTAVSSKGHPKLGSTEAFPVALTPGHAGGGFLDRVYIVSNVFDHTKMARAEATNTAGVQISEDRQAQGAKFGFNNVFITGNKMTGLGRGVTIQLFRTPGFVSPPSYMAIENNEMNAIVLEPIHIKQQSATTAADFVFIGGNLFTGSPKPYRIENTTAVIVKKNNSCLIWRNKDRRKNIPPNPGYWTQALGCN